MTYDFLSSDICSNLVINAWVLCDCLRNPSPLRDENGGWWRDVLNDHGRVVVVGWGNLECNLIDIFSSGLSLEFWDMFQLVVPQYWRCLRSRPRTFPTLPVPELVPDLHWNSKCLLNCTPWRRCSSWWGWRRWWWWRGSSCARQYLAWCRSSQTALPSFKVNWWRYCHVYKIRCGGSRRSWYVVTCIPKFCRRHLWKVPWG